MMAALTEGFNRPLLDGLEQSIVALTTPIPILLHVGLAPRAFLP